MSRRINLDDYYTAEEATKRLSENAGREIDANYPRTLVRYGKIRAVNVGKAKLYYKADVDHYVVSDHRGPRSRSSKTQPKGTDGEKQPESEETLPVAV